MMYMHIDEKRRVQKDTRPETRVPMSPVSRANRFSNKKLPAPNGSNFWHYQLNNVPISWSFVNHEVGIWYRRDYFWHQHILVIDVVWTIVRSVVR